MQAAGVQKLNQQEKSLRLKQILKVNPIRKKDVLDMNFYTQFESFTLQKH